MPDYDQLLQANLPQALETAFEAINGVFEKPEQLMQVNVSEFEALDCCVFAYFSRDDVFYLNRAGRNLLKLRLPFTASRGTSSPPIFWLEHDVNLASADTYVATRGKAILKTRELVTLSWGKTWLEGAKFPIQSVDGQTLALLFAGRELAPSEQIRQVADHYQQSLRNFGEN